MNKLLLVTSSSVVAPSLASFGTTSRSASWRPNEGAMRTITIYKYTLLNTRLGEPRVARRWGTREAIEGLKGSAKIIEFASALVDALAVDSLGFTALDFDPSAGSAPSGVDVA